MFLINGAGLAGITLAWQFYKNNLAFTIYDKNLPKASGKAAGIFNPMIFKRITKSWAVDDCLPFANQFYQEIEVLLNKKFWYSLPLYKALHTIKEVNDWQAKRGDNAYKNYLGNVDEFTFKGLKKVNYIGLVYQAGFVDLETYLNASTQFFLENGFLKTTTEQSNCTNYKTIWCEGPHALNGPFGFLPFVLAKGETLTISAPELELNGIFKKDFFILPLAKNIFKVGATYQWNHLNWQPSQEGKNILIEKLNEMINCPFEILAHKAGIRPTVKDRRPLLGEHPTQKNNFIFNGLGSKGVMLAPFFAQVMVEHLALKKPILPEINILRFTKNYYE